MCCPAVSPQYPPLGKSMTFANFASLFITLLFAVFLMAVATDIRKDYLRLKTALYQYTDLMKVMITRVERQEKFDLAPEVLKLYESNVQGVPPVRSVPESAQQDDTTRPTEINLPENFLAESRQFLHRIISAFTYSSEPFHPKLSDLYQSLSDFLKVGPDVPIQRDEWITFKRVNQQFQSGLVTLLESNRTKTETLPFIGILGTLMGFLLALGDIGGSAATTSGLLSVAGVGGLFLAVLSTMIALSCVVFLKLRYEAKIVPQYLEFEELLGVLESFAEWSNTTKNLTNSAPSTQKPVQ